MKRLTNAELDALAWKIRSDLETLKRQDRELKELYARKKFEENTKLKKALDVLKAYERTPGSDFKTTLTFKLPPGAEPIPTHYEIRCKLIIYQLNSPDIATAVDTLVTEIASNIGL